MSRRLSAIRFAARLRNQVDPTANARVVAVWEGIRRTHGAPPEQAGPLMPPELFDTLSACPHTKVWKTRGRPSEPDLAGLRDVALLLSGSWPRCAAASWPPWPWPTWPSTRTAWCCRSPGRRPTRPASRPSWSSSPGPAPRPGAQ